MSGLRCRILNSKNPWLGSQELTVQAWDLEDSGVVTDTFKRETSLDTKRQVSISPGESALPTRVIPGVPLPRTADRAPEVPDRVSKTLPES
jgi:hypothetical protein